MRSAAIGMWVGVGSRDEPDAIAGAAHYLEHLLFKGTTRRTAAQIAEEIDAVGGELNAFTGKEHTCYYAHVLDADLTLGLDLVCDVLGFATLDPADVELERSVVLEEIAIRDDDPEDLLYEEYAGAWLGSHPLGRSILGSVESVTALKRDDLLGFYEQRYTPDRMVLSVAGNVTHEAVLEALSRSFGDRLGSVATPVGPRRGPALDPSGSRLALRTEDCEQAHLLVGVPGLDRHDERRFALGVLNAALGGGMSSRLFQEVRERRGLAYSVHSGSSAYSDIGQLSIYTGCNPEKLGEAVGVIDEIRSDIARGGLTDAEIARGKGQLRGSLVLGLEDTGAHMSRIGKAELHHGRHRTVEEVLDLIDGVSAAQVTELARDLLDRSLTAAVVGPYAAQNDLPAQLLEVIRR